MTPSYLRAALAATLLPVSVFAHSHGHNEEPAATIQERLGYSADAKLLIIHGDDLGMAHTKNTATFRAMEEGVMTSASVMMPTPWVAEVVEYARANPEADIGVHLTLTSEWKYYKTYPVAGKDQVPSLVTEYGVFYHDVPSFAAAASIEDIEKEARAQIDLALSLGIDVTHLDGHMGSMMARDDIKALFLKLGEDYQVPLRVHTHADQAAEDEAVKQALDAYELGLDTILGVSTEAYPAGMIEEYNQMLRDLEPGLNMIVLHTAYDGPEMRAITVDHPLWGAQWRQIDFDWAVSPETRRIIEEEGIILIDHREVRDKLMRGAKSE
jgi:predicted glycoside hydrolase/deacetylase ChbG (UPF0249 family)